MFKGFYNLTSAMLTHQRNLNVVGNNMANISTAGFKQSRYTATTFDEVLYSRVGNVDGQGEPIGKQSYIRATSEICTDYEQGPIEPTGLPLDFAVDGKGFFAVEKADGTIGYTRMGNFVLDPEGYLTLPGFGRVLDMAQNPLQLRSDKVSGDDSGRIFYKEGGYAGQLGLFEFDDMELVEEDEKGLFVGENTTIVEAPHILNGCVERSNTDMVRQMTEMISVQRSLQSAAQVSKMYDQLMTKAANELGRL